MQIDFVILGNAKRIQNVRDDWTVWSRDHADEVVTGATFLVVHTHGEYDRLNTWLNAAEAGGGVCFVSEGPLGVRKELVKRLEIRNWPSRWHVLTDAVTENATNSLRKRFSSFLQSVAKKAPGDEIPWKMLEPSETFENLIAFYLWCLAAPSLSKIEDIERPTQIYDVADLAADELDRAQVTDQTKAKFRTWRSDGAALDLDACQELVTILRPIVSTRTE